MTELLPSRSKSPTQLAQAEHRSVSVLRQEQEVRARQTDRVPPGEPRQRKKP